MVKGLFIMDTASTDVVYPPNIKREIESLADIYSPPMTAKDVIQDTSILQEAKVIFSGWGGPKLDKQFLDAAPHLQAIFYAAGSIKSIVTEEAWNRNLIITTANMANAIPVAEYTLSQILFLLKRGWALAHQIKSSRTYPERPYHIPGAYGSTVGIISLSAVGRKVIELLQHFDIKILAYDPFVPEEEAQKYKIELCTLKEIFERSDVVSLHTPLLEETKGMIHGEYFDSMKPHASFINTARGAIVREAEMVEVLEHRNDITAVLDVTDPEPPVHDSPLYRLPNAILTPHIAGSEGTECGRMGTMMLDEFKRYLNDETLKWQVTKQKFKLMA